MSDPVLQRSGSTAQLTRPGTMAMPAPKDAPLDTNANEGVSRTEGEQQGANPTQTAVGTGATKTSMVRDFAMAMGKGHLMFLGLLCASGVFASAPVSVPLLLLACFLVDGQWTNSQGGASGGGSRAASAQPSGGSSIPNNKSTGQDKGDPEDNGDTFESSHGENSLYASDYVNIENGDPVDTETDQRKIEEAREAERRRESAVDLETGNPLPVRPTTNLADADGDDDTAII